MIGWFPSPYPEELFYSICARYMALMQYPNQNSNIEMSGGVVIVDLPCNLRYFTMLLPPNQYYTVDAIIDQHSLLNFYIPFLPGARLESIRSEMSLANGKLVHKILGLSGSSIKYPVWLRYCPSCVLSDRRQFGETYWHRQHQLQGVRACTIHQVFLENSSVATRNREGKLFCAERFALANQARCLKSEDPSDRAYSYLARDAAWLLSQTSPSRLGVEALRDGFAAVLRDTGFVMRDGRRRLTEVARAVKNAYPQELLRSLQNPIDENGARVSWVHRFMNNLFLHDKAVHPLQFLLLTQFFGLKAESFFAQAAKKQGHTQPPSSRFGSAPYPCLNPVCDSFKQRVITHVILKYRRGRQYSEKPVGTFTCECGYSYTRRSWSASATDIFRRENTIAYGAVWESALREMWQDQSLYLEDLSKKLCVGLTPVKYQAVTLGLRFPRFGPKGKLTRVKQSFVESVLRSPRSKPGRIRLINANREKWLRLINQHRGLSRTMLTTRIAPHLWKWLHTHDRAWLKANMPPPHSPRCGRPRKDWATLDAQMSEGVLRAALLIRNAEGFPARVNKKIIALQNGWPRTLDISKVLCKLPLTRAAFDQVLESHSAYGLRRIRWTTEWYKHERLTQPGVTEFMRRAHLSSRDLQVYPELRTSINSALASLDSSQSGILPGFLAA